MAGRPAGRTVMAAAEVGLEGGGAPTALRPEAAMQRTELMPLLKMVLRPGESWYLIDSRWFKQWKKYVGFESWDLYNVGEPNLFPGPIDNSGLFTDSETQTLKEHLIDELDYVLVPTEAWDKLANWYGCMEGQKPIVRKVVEYGLFVKHCKVEVYLLELKLCQNSDPTTLVDSYFSKADTIATIEKEMRKQFNIPDGKDVRLWNKCTNNAYEQLSKLDSTIQDAGLYQGQVVLIEVKNEDGSWPRQSSLTKTCTASSRNLATSSKAPASSCSSVAASSVITNGDSNNSYGLNCSSLGKGKVATVGAASTTPSSSPSGGQRSIQAMLHQENTKESSIQTILQTLQRMEQQQQRMEQQLLKRDEKVQRMEQQLLKTDENVVNIQRTMSKYEERLVKLEEKDDQKEEKMKEIENRLGEVEQGTSGLIGWEMDKAEFYLRFQNVEEEKGENLAEIMNTMLADLLEVTKEKMMEGVDEIYRVSTGYAMRNKLPREVHIRFTKKSIKAQILQAVHDKALKYKGKEVTVLRQIPRKVRALRRGYQFLTKVLLQKGINYRWLFPEGVGLTWQFQRYRLNTIDKARAFYEEVLKEKEVDMQVETQTTVVPIKFTEEELIMLETDGAVGGVVEHKEQREARSTRATKPIYKV